MQRPEQTNNAPRASQIIVAVPALNEADFIAACLTSLGLDTPEMAQVIFVVADGGSTDGTRDIVADMAQSRGNLHLLDNPAKLQSAGVNAAWIVDTPLGSGGASHRGGKASRFVDHGHHAAFDRESFNEIGGYDARFSHNEDAEYDRRLTEAGGRIWLDAGIRLTYFMRPTPRALARQYYTYGRGRMRTLLKHGDRPKLRQMLPVVLLCICILSLGAGALIHPWGFAAVLGYGAILLGASLWVATRHRSLCGLWAGVALGLMHLSWAVGAIRMWLSR